MNEAQAKVADLEGQLQEIESDVAQMSRLIGESTRLSHALKEFADNERELEQRWNVVDRLRLEVERLEAVHGESKAQLDSADSKWQRRQELIAVLETSTEALKALEAEAEDAVPGFTAATRRSEGAITALNEAEASLLEARKEFTRAVADRDHLRQLIEVEQLKERHERYLATERTLKEAEEYLESAVVDDDVAKRIEDAYIADERAKSAAGSAAGSIEVTALREINVEVGGELVELATNEVKRLRPNEETEMTAMRVVMEYEESLGRQVKDVHEQNLGYDVTSLDVISGELRLIEVKGLAAATGTILLSPNERRVAEDRRDCYWLYIVTNCAATPQLQEPIKDPAQFEWREVSKVQHYWMEVNAMTKPMQVREEQIPYA